MHQKKMSGKTKEERKRRSGEQEYHTGAKVRRSLSEGVLGDLCMDLFVIIKSIFSEKAIGL